MDQGLHGPIHAPGYRVGVGVRVRVRVRVRVKVRVSATSLSVHLCMRFGTSLFNL